MFVELKRAIGGSVLEPYPKYRSAIGVLGLALPVVLLAGSQSVQGSISAYYHTGMRDWFVGTLWVIGVFLFFYTYTPQDATPARSQRPTVQSGWADAALGKIAGVSAVCVALFPTTAPGQMDDGTFSIGWVHGLAAVVLFGCLSLFPLVLFSQSRDWARFYKGCGWTMVACLAALVVYTLGPEVIQGTLQPFRPVFFLEWLLIWAFASSWFAKGLQPAMTGAPARAA